MEIDDVLPSLRAPMRRAQLPLPLWFARFATRRMPVPTSDSVTVTTESAGAADVRVYVPSGERSGAGLLWVHGGGLLFGDARQDEALCLSTAEALGIVVVSANYRLGPRHPFPAAHDDVRGAWAWFLGHAERFGIDPARIAIGGESAGGGLAAALVQRVRDDGGVQPAAQWLFAPMLDDRTAADRSLDAARHFIWANPRNRLGWTAYLGVEPGGASAPRYAVPARADDLSRLPPAFITWGDIELFAAEDAAYAEALRAAGVPVEVDVVEGAPHGFENWAKETDEARALMTRARRWLGGALAP